MRTTVILDGLRQSDLRPSGVYSEYGRLLREDVAQFLTPDPAAWRHRACPGCDAANSPVAFAKEGFTYKRCPSCATLFADPVPTQAALSRVRATGKSAAYQSKMFTGELAAARRRHVQLSLLQWITGTLDEHETFPHTYYGWGKPESNWLDLVVQSNLFKRVLTERLDPSDLTDVVSLFDDLDKVSDPEALLEETTQHLVPNGLLFLTMISGSGLEYQLLGSDAPNLLPLDRLTLFSVEAIRQRLERIGYTVIELSTPGRFDVETLRNYVRDNPAGVRLPFWDYFFSRNDEQSCSELQLFLQQHHLSSYLRVVARKN